MNRMKNIVHANRNKKNRLYIMPRRVSSHGTIRWNGFVYQNKRLLQYTEETVYISEDDGFIYVFEVESTPLNVTEQGLRSEWRLNIITHIPKHCTECGKALKEPLRE